MCHSMITIEYTRSFVAFYVKGNPDSVVNVVSFTVSGLKAESAAAESFPYQTLTEICKTCRACLKKGKGDEEDTRTCTPLNIIGC